MPCSEVCRCESEYSCDAWNRDICRYGDGGSAAWLTPKATLQDLWADRCQNGSSPILMAAANSSGGVMGNLMDPQSILVSATATQQVGKEGEILRTVFKHSLILTSLLGLIVLFSAYAVPGATPRP